MNKIPEQLVYEYMGVETYKRTDLDEEGNTYPLLYMNLKIKKVRYLDAK